MNKKINSSSSLYSSQKLSLYKQVRAEILNMIMNEQMPPDTKLPSESLIAKRYGVSKMVSKMALDMLADEGYIYRHPRRGSFVSKSGEPDKKNSFVSAEKEKQEKRLVGIIMPEIGPYCADIIRSLEKYFDTLGYNIILKISDHYLEVEEQALRELAQSNVVSGIVLFPSNRRFCGDQLVRMQLERYPIVLIDNTFHALSLDSISHNHYMGAYEMTNYLIDFGHERICFLTTDIAAYYSRQERILGFQNAIIDRNLVFSKDMIYELSKIECLEKYKKFLQANCDFTAVFCSDDHIAAQLLYTAFEMNIKVPEDISVVGFTDNAILRFLPLGITTVRQPINRFCKEAASLLVRKIEEPGKNIESIVINTEIVERESVYTVNYPRP